jgi:cell division protein FtsB
LNIRKKTSKKRFIKFSFFELFNRYWFTIFLFILVVTLIRQSVFINDFPKSLESKRIAVNEIIASNESLKLKNKSLLVELNTEEDAKLEVLESQARFRLGFVKDGETYYQIRKHKKSAENNTKE